MKNLLKNQVKFLITIVLVLGLSISLQSLLASWTPPDANPPLNNVDEPINTSGLFQVKKGSLGLGDSSTSGNPYLMFTTNGANMGIGDTQHYIFGPYDGGSGDSGALYISTGRSADKVGDNRNSINFYNYSCTGGNCNVPNIGLYADTTQLAGDLLVSGNIKTIAGNIFLKNDTQRLYGDGSSALYYDSSNSNVSQMIFRDTEDTIYGRVYGVNNGSAFGLLDADGNWSYLAAKDDYTAFRINDSTKMLILANGRVGIGTDSPSSKLEVNGNVSAKKYCDENGANCISASAMGGGVLSSTSVYTKSCMGFCTVSCNAGDIRTGCSSFDISGAIANESSSAGPINPNGCSCHGWSPDLSTCYAYCIDL